MKRSTSSVRLKYFRRARALCAVGLWVKRGSARMKNAAALVAAVTVVSANALGQLMGEDESTFVSNIGVKYEFSEGVRARSSWWDGARLICARSDSLYLIGEHGACLVYLSDGVMVPGCASYMPDGRIALWLAPSHQLIAIDPTGVQEYEQLCNLSVRRDERLRTWYEEKPIYPVDGAVGCLDDGVLFAYWDGVRTHFVKRGMQGEGGDEAVVLSIAAEVRCWQADSRMGLVYSVANGESGWELVFCDVNGDAYRQLRLPEGADGRFAFSPDGSSYLLFMTSARKRSIACYNQDGERISPMISGSGAVWNPEGTAFVMYQGWSVVLVDVRNEYEMEVLISRREPIGSARASYVAPPAWDPTGQRVVVWFGQGGPLALVQPDAEVVAIDLAAREVYVGGGGGSRYFWIDPKSWTRGCMELCDN